jgi:cytochrome oxidase Cu insertion factor (SCO1/SenC/PrrC family)
MRATTTHGYARFTACFLLLLGVLTGGESLSATDVLQQLPRQWLDDQGRTLDLAAFSGRRVYFTMAYASCRRICPMTIARLQELQREADRNGESAEFVIVGYDPTEDDPGTWQQYRRNRGLDRDNWHFLSGTAGNTEQFARRLGFPFWKYDRHVMHEYRIVVVDEHGQLAAEYTAASAQTHVWAASDSPQKNSSQAE